MPRSRDLHLNFGTPQYLRDGKSYKLAEVISGEDENLRALLIALLLSSTAIITSTVIHLFYDLILTKHINCLRCCLVCYSLLLLFIFHVFPFYFNIFFLGNAVFKLHTNIFT